MVNLSNEEILEIRDYIAHAVNQYNTSIYISSFYKTLDKYKEFIDDFQKESVFVKNPKLKKKINSFQKASYLLLAINDSKISKDENINRQIAIEVALQIIQDPIEVKGEYFNEEVTLESITEEDLSPHSKQQRDTILFMLQSKNTKPYLFEQTLREIYAVAIQKQKKKNKKLEKVKEQTKNN